MRAWAVNKIKGLSTLPKDINDRVYSSGNPTDRVAPFIDVSLGTEQTPLGMPAESRTKEIPLDIYVHDRPGTMTTIDEVVQALQDFMPSQAPAVVGGISVYECKYEETTGDGFDDMYKTNFRRVSFRLMTRRSAA